MILSTTTFRVIGNMKILIIIFSVFINFSTLLHAEEKVYIPSIFQEKRTFALEGQKVYSITATNNNDIYASTKSALSYYSKSLNQWSDIGVVKKPGLFIDSNGKQTAVFTVAENEKPTGGFVYLIEDQRITNKIPLTKKFKVDIHFGDIALSGEKIFIASSDDLFTFNIPTSQKPILELEEDFPGQQIKQIAVAQNNSVFVASASGLYKNNNSKEGWLKILPKSGDRSWALADCRSVAVDSRNRLWFASPQGVGVFDGSEWTLYEGKDGLPYNDFTKMAAGMNGDVWFGTHKGAIHFDGKTWEYRQGKRWLPDDNVNDIVVSNDGSVWIATDKGISRIYEEKMTLAEKAKWYEDEIDRYHRRTPYEFVLEVSLPAPADKSSVRQRDSDNDGLWTGMYGAGECFAYAATKDPKAKARAKKAFEALQFLGEVTQGAPISPPPGFVARTILPTSGQNPNDGRVERDKKKHDHDDNLWKVYEPRWPISKDGKWYYKTDTSSDELDGHYFLYALYYDLVAETADEKAQVREHVKKLTDHLIDHDFQLVDHDGKPTRWARFNPYELNHDKNWFVERGLNSLSMLSYLAVTYHMTGDQRYRDLSNMLIEDHSYAQNLIDMKFNRGVGTGNQSDDEMAFMAYYNLINYETDPELKSIYAFSMYMNWMLEASELNPFFNFAFRAVTAGLDFEDAWGTYDLEPHAEWLDESVETLMRFPLDRLNWRHENSHRTDIVKLHYWNHTFDEEYSVTKGYRVNGKVIPVDERHFNHWNHGPWELNTGGNGQGLSTGTVFLLPYYMGLYHGFIEE